jgi:carboxypeptidase family protein
MNVPALTTAFVLLVALTALPALAQESRPYQGLPLVEALSDLQARGLRIIFSSAIVRSDLRVFTEPRGTTAREQLDELLAPHGLMVREGPGGTLQVVRRQRPKPSRQESHGSLEGRVVDDWTEAPLARVHIRVDGHSEETRTDASGQFAVLHLATGRRIVTASAAGYSSARHVVAIDAGSTATVTVRLLPEIRRYEEFVSVIDSAPSRTDRGVASESSLERDQFARLPGAVTDDPLRAVHALPGVTAVDDFQSDFAVRGSPFRHVDLVVDGVSTHWLRHTAFGSGATGSLMMLSGLVVDRATLRSGAYPRRHGERLGSELELSLREGSRAEFAMRGAVGGTHAVVAAEGPLGDPGPSGSARGSWLISGRQSYLEWPPERFASSRTPFGFSDALAKVIFDVRPTQQITVTAIRGTSSVDEEIDNIVSSELMGINRASVVSLSWRSTVAPTFVIRQRASVVSQDARDTGRDGPESGAVANRALSYRTELVHPLAGGTLEAGGLIERTRTSQTSRKPEGSLAAGSSWQRSGYAHFSWPVTLSFTVSPGVRVTSSTLAHTPVVSRWLLGEWSFRRNWSLIGSAGSSRQLPELLQVLGDTGSAGLQPERAMHLEAGIEQQLTSGVRWQVTLFSRREADVIRNPDLQPRLVGNALVLPAAGDRLVNALRGTSRGIELLVTRRSSRGLSGWATYAYGRTRHSDAAKGEVFWADFDQRHTFSMFALYRVTPVTSITGTFHAGSNVPIPGYLTRTNGRLLVGSARNQVRLPSYARLDLRADRQFHYLGRSFAVFGETLNVLNRTNVGLADGRVDPVTFEAIGFTDRLLRRRLSAGVVFEF